MHNNSIKQSLLEARDTLEAFLQESETIGSLDQIAQNIAEAFDKGNKVLVCGNGGSACDAMHCAEEFTGRFKKDRKALPAIALTDPGYLTCVANDYGYDQVFQRGVEAYGKEGDVFIGLTTSGHSKNIIKATQEAKRRHLITVVLSGKDGGDSRDIADYDVIVPCNATARIQEIHMLLLHALIEEVEHLLFPDLYKIS